MRGLPKRLMWRRAMVVVHDACWIPLAIAAAFWVRFNMGAIPAEFIEPMILMAVVALPIHATSFWYFGCYRGVWRFASMPDLFRLSKAIACGTLVTLVAMFVYNRLDGVPRSVGFLYPLFLIVSTGGARAVYRVFKELVSRSFPHPGVQRVLVVGAGNGGEHLIHGLRTRHDLQPVGIVDDDPMKWGTELYGVRVLGPINQLTELARRYQADTVIVAIPSAPRDLYSRVLARTNDAGLPCQISNPLADNKTMASGATAIRPVTTEDVLGREPVILDETAIAATLQGRTVLVTGGGGSIGLELCKRVLGHEPAHLVVLDSAEYNLYLAERELTQRSGDTNISFVLGDVVDRPLVERLFTKYRPDVVLHAAAYKHVPLLESNVLVGARNNILGTRVVAETAASHGTDRFVLVSTDKTVNPTNVMGATKRVAEKLCLDLQKRATGTDFLITRFGNVLGSAGSVIPLFERQISQGGPVTVTHPDVKRFFMTVEEATGLIIQATALSHGGEVFVLEMGEPVLIRELAENMIRLSGLRPGEDIKIVYTGLRPGEKLEEELFYDTENLSGTAHSKLLLAECSDSQSQDIEQAMTEIEAGIKAGDETRVLRAIQELVPAFNRYVPDTPPHTTVAGRPLRVIK